MVPEWCLNYAIFIGNMTMLWAVVLLQVWCVSSEIRDSTFLNKLKAVKPVGPSMSRSFVPLTELPRPALPHYHLDGRRHFQDCTPKPTGWNVDGAGTIDVNAEYYDERDAKTVATVIIPDHIDRKHFQVTTEVPYLTLGTIDALGYHPSTLKSDHPSDCEKIYQEHMADMYSDETTDYSEESLEMARIPLFPPDKPSSDKLRFLDRLYSDIDERVI